MTYAAALPVPDGPSVTCTFAPPAITMDAAGVIHVRVTGCSPWLRTGEAVLPFRTLRLLLPSGCTATGVIARATAPTLSFYGIKTIEIAREPAAFSSIAALSAAPIIQPASSPKTHPLAELLSVQRLAGYTLAILRVFPTDYYAESNLLTFTPEVAIEVLLASSPSAEISPSTHTADRLRVTSAVDNPDAIFTQERVLPSMIGGPATNYLLVTRAALLPAFQPLIECKQADGLTVLTQTMESVTNLYAGVDAAEKLRTFIRYAYTNWGVQYVLLGGDITIVPTRGVYARCAGITLNQMPSDLYFACLDGSWNRDGDALWGEPTDGETGGDVDLLPEVRVGRAPVETAAEVTNFVARCLAAESAPEPRFSACFAGEYLFNGGAQGGDALDALLPAFSNSFCPVSWLDDRPQQTDVWTYTDALAALNRSPLLVAHFGHGSDSRYDTTVMRLISSDLDGLNNASPFLLYSTACNAGAFDNDQWGADCVGEELVKRGAHGAFAVVMNAREGWYDVTDESRYSGEFQQHFFNHLLSAHKNEIGAAHEQAKQDLLGSVETRGTSMPYRWCFFGLNLLGDPHAAIRVPLSLGFNMGPVSRTLTWNSWPNTAYAVYRATDLTEVLGTCIATNLLATPPLNIYIDNAPPVPRAFYRVRSL